MGNLPPGTHIIDLKDHLARDATEDIQSVFLISKSNCAFVNYKTPQSCAAAMTRFHESRFEGMRLVCRLRRGSSPVATTPEFSRSSSKDTIQVRSDSSHENALQSPNVVDEQVVSSAPAKLPAKLVKEKFFIVKSLTQEDIDRAVTTSTWATQSQNEQNFNLAFNVSIATRAIRLSLTKQHRQQKVFTLSSP